MRLARKSSAGYDMKSLYVGSEGTLGVITEIQLRLHGIPEAMSSATCQFPTLRDAVETVIAIMQTGIPVARMELLDDVQTAASIAYSKLEGLEALPSLFFEFHGTPAAVKEQAEQAQDIAHHAYRRGRGQCDALVHGCLPTISSGPTPAKGTSS